MIRFSLLYLLTGFTIGSAMLAGKAYPAFAAVWMLLPVHIEMLIFGFIIQFTMGTAYWILPRYLKGPSRGNTVWSNVMVGALNVGILINVLTSLNVVVQWGTLLGRFLEVFAVILFIKLHWNRAVSYRS
jgi:hypothetical protein